MSKNSTIFIGVIALVVIIGGIYTSLNNRNDVMTTNDQVDLKAMEDKQVADEGEVMMKNDDIKTDSMTKTDETSAMEKSDTMVKAGTYEAYAPAKVTLHASLGHNVVLFFRASWCPTCRAVDRDIRANLSKIPTDLAILDVDYDNSTALKQKYGVTYQHTFVQVDKDGNLIKKWSGSPTLSALVLEVK